MSVRSRTRLMDAMPTAQRRLYRSLDQALSEEDASIDQWRVLGALSGADGLLMGELSERLQIPPASITRLVDGLVDQARVYRRQSTADRRRVAVHLADSGKDALSRMDAMVQVQEDRLRAAMGADEFAALTRAAQRVCDLPSDAI